MMIKYLVRLDDACPTMDRSKWDRIESILDANNIRPLVGVIPNNKDSMLEISHPDPTFWTKVKNWEQKGWTIALHGYDHCYLTQDAGMNPMWYRSEFAGVSLEAQKRKISDGLLIFKEHGHCCPVKFPDDYYKV